MPGTDDADSADASTVQTQAGDVVVLATDGLFDNLFDEDIAQICSNAVGSYAAAAGAQAAGEAGAAARTLAASDAAGLAQDLAQAAHCQALNPKAHTPWSMAAADTCWAHLFADGGGKMDDITVVVCFVSHVLPLH